MISFLSREFFNRMTGWVLLFKRLVGLVLLFLAFGYFQQAMGGNQARVLPKPFVSNVAQARQAALTNQKHMLVDFGADWCEPCEEWDKNVFSNPEVQKVLESDWVALRIDCTHNDNVDCVDLTRQYGVIGFPTLIFLNQDGHEAADSRLVGQIMSAKEFLTYLRRFQKEQP
jgi:thiol:disulfide interchange protein DsbD